MIKAVIFDFDGVLVDSHGIINRLFTRIANEELGLNITENEFAKFPGARFEKRVELLAAEKGKKITKKQIDEAVSKGREEYYENSSNYIELFFGVRELMETIRKSGLKMGIGTNGSRVS